MNRRWLTPYGTQVARITETFGWCLSASLNIPNSNICETRLYCLYCEFTATHRMSGKNLLTEIFEPNVEKVCYF